MSFTSIMKNKKNEEEKLSDERREIAKRWRDLSGQNQWNGMLQPLDQDLRQYIIHYGEIAQACYDTFNTNTQSKFAGASIYSREDFFAKVGLEKAHPYTKYKVTKFIYATSQIDVPQSFLLFPLSREGWTKESNWIGYVAVTDDEGTTILGRRDVVVAWRDTMQTLEWVNDLEYYSLVDAKKIFGEKKDQVRVHQGWYSIYMSENETSPFNKANARDQVLREVGRLLEKYKDEEVSITVCGHSLGAALTTLNAADIVSNGYNRPKSRPDKSCQVTAFVFASPRVGDFSFKKLVSGLEDLRVLRIRNLPDVVPLYPQGYSEVGEELPIDTTKSPYMKFPGNAATVHSLESYLHGVAGTQGTTNAHIFRLDVKRDMALVNKLVDGLKDEFMVPGNWWVLKNKGMVQQDDGSWKLLDHETDDNEDLDF